MKIFLNGRLAGTITWEVSREIIEKLFGNGTPEQVRHGERMLHAVLSQVGERFFEAVLASLEKPPEEIPFSLQHLGIHLRQFPNGDTQASQMGDD